MRMTTLEEELDLVEFVKEAAEWFVDHPEGKTYTRCEIRAGVPFAVRWGLGNDCILTFTIGDLPPVIYQNCIKIKPVETIKIPVPKFDDDIPF